MRPPATKPSGAAKRARGGVELRAVDLVLLDEQPFDAGGDRRRHDVLVPDGAVADGTVRRRLSRAEVLDVDERARVPLHA